MSVSLHFLSKKLVRFLLLIAVTFPALLHASAQTALDDYVNAPDSSYNFTLADHVVGEGYTLYVVYMYSQQWRSLAEVDRIQWTHWLAIVVPDVVATDTSMLIIAGKDNSDTPNLGTTEVVVAAEIAKNSASIVSVLGQVPNQPLFFADEPFEHSEDEVVAYTFDKAMDTGDWLWPAYLPMTKASVRAMDTIQAVSSDPEVETVPVRQFVVTGFSKRGAITWLTAVVDPRVRAIAPGVFDTLNMDEQLEHHFSAYGFYSDALDDYVNYNVLRRVRTPEGQVLMQVVDPLSYKERLTMPKFILNSSGDPFYTPDSARFYFDALEGENLIRYVANTGHDLETAPDDIEDAVTSLVSWYLGILTGMPRPTISWQHNDGHLIVQTDQPVYAARFWQAHNPTARDFRLETIGRSWSDITLIPTGPGTYSVPVPTPSDGWTAYFVDLIYPGVAGVPQTYSTSIFISPDTLPYEVTDPLLDPRGVGFWRRQVIGKRNVKIPADVLAGYLPIPLFDQYVTTIEDAKEIFTTRNRDPRARARKQCLALRLNVRDGQLGWYTSVTLDDDYGDDDHYGHDDDHGDDNHYGHDDDHGDDDHYGDDDNGHDDDNGDDNTSKLWEVYSQAHEAFLAGQPQKARAICAAVNRL
ncbi:MAG: PhoPQ-activated protein PqaA family protein [Gammaproteobacteria bacterium]|jgi:PhoPQ-activated pathogenicity-related protein